MLANFLTGHHKNWITNAFSGREVVMEWPTDLHLLIFIFLDRLESFVDEQLGFPLFSTVFMVRTMVPVNSLVVHTRPFATTLLLLLLLQFRSVRWTVVVAHRRRVDTVRDACILDVVRSHDRRQWHEAGHFEGRRSRETRTRLRLGNSAEKDSSGVKRVIVAERHRRGRLEKENLNTRCLLKRVHHFAAQDQFKI